MYNTFSQIIVGFSEKDYLQNKSLGLTKRSYGYKSDGKIYHNKPEGDNYGPKFDKGDVIGCGLVLSQR